ncbi:RluA family pseudouridine synthase [Chengkuizengella axinellae]|uniref:RNA pseudouridylate synthase n=1 Tax=Chengkuizengella axinellae TaxID=3064388 RepID=A0ABT9IXE3_9BACL|nr:RluA family pseudouridine synthase [Chengkuizengella sp. 2205SS18-9]MDP5273913.1 RluA family pseudouridine synthase [Chengkuizengella sp. 2205SS18-9]
MKTQHPIPVIYEDNHILIVEKPVNIPTQQDISGDMDLLTMLKQDIKERYNKPGNVFLGLVHRLDRPVGGVMVFAKTSKAASRLSNSIRTHQMEKEYMAVIHGTPSKQKGKLIHYLKKDTNLNKVYSVAKNVKDSKEAILEYEIKGSRDGFSLAQIRLHTGRSHQIRVQFSEIGCPLYGDQKYGEKGNKKNQQIALWSKRISFCHPTLKNDIEFHSSPPPVFPWNLWKGNS